MTAHRQVRVREPFLKRQRLLVDERMAPLLRILWRRHGLRTIRSCQGGPPKSGEWRLRSFHPSPDDPRWAERPYITFKWLDDAPRFVVLFAWAMDPRS